MAPTVLTLKQLRDEAELTQAQLAELAGVRQATVSDLETGKSRRIELDLIDSLCKPLGKALGRSIAPDELFKLERDAKRKGRK